MHAGGSHLLDVRTCSQHMMRSGASAPELCCHADAGASVLRAIRAHSSAFVVRLWAAMLMHRALVFSPAGIELDAHHKGCRTPWRYLDSRPSTAALSSYWSLASHTVSRRFQHPRFLHVSTQPHQRTLCHGQRALFHRLTSLLSHQNRGLVGTALYVGGEKLALRNHIWRQVKAGQNYLLCALLLR